MQVSGQVTAITARSTQYGEMYDVVVNGKKYGHGKYAPRGIKEGDFVTMEVEVKQNGQYTNYNIAKGTLRKDEGSGSQATAPAPRTEAKQQFVPFDARQETISKQAALNTALSFCTLAAANGAIPMPKGVKEADKLGLIYQWVLDTAGSFYGLSTGQKWAMPESKPAAIEKPKAAANKASDVPFPVDDSDDDKGYNEYPDSN